MTDRTIHPDPKCQRNQQALLDSLDGELREMMAYTHRVGNVTFHYYSEQLAEPTEEDYEDWLLGLPEEIAKDHSERGFEKCRGVLSLRRHAAERNDSGLDAYVKESVSEEDYRRWSELRDKSLANQREKGE
ncbi:hypothetical protein [Persicitalea jodogahamensis]|nr:hypothetical protein [Persicitalea jodogahamensis]